MVGLRKALFKPRVYLRPAVNMRRFRKLFDAVNINGPPIIAPKEGHRVIKLSPRELACDVLT